MYAKRYCDIKKAQKQHESQISAYAKYPVWGGCKQKIDFDCNCLKCGACGRTFDENGNMVH